MKVRWGLRLLVAAAGMSPMVNINCDAQTLSPYSEFLQMSEGQLSQLQVKLTYVGTRAANAPTFIITATGHVPNAAVFKPFYRSGISYAMDYLTPQTVSAATSELRALIAEVGNVPSVTDGGIDSDAFISFALYNNVGGSAKVFESILNEGSARPLFTRMAAALASNGIALKAVRQEACGYRVLEGAPPQDVTASTTVTFTGLRRDRRSQEYVGTVRIKNTSGATLPGPMLLTMDLSHPNVELLNAGGRTCLILPRQPYVELNAGQGLAANATTEVMLRFSNPEHELVQFGWKVFSGAGVP